MAGRILYYGGIVKNGLVLDLDAAKLDSYNRTGTAWNDISGNRNNGVLTNGPTYSNLNGGSIVFDGTNDYVNTTIISLKQLVSRPCALSVWFKTNINTSTRQAIIADWNAAGNSETTRLEISGYNITSGKVGGTLITNSGGSGTVQSTTTIQSNIWYNVVIQCPTTTSTELYLNGILENTVTSVDSAISSGTVTLGRGGAYNGLYLSGNISTTLIYNRALSAIEILQNYNATKNRYI